MTDETIAVPRALLTELAKAASESERSALASQAFDLLPMHGPRLVLINLDSPGPLSTSDMWTHVNKLEGAGVGFELGALLSRIDGALDPMAVIEQTVESFLNAESGVRAELVARIRAALEGATR